MEFFAVHWAYLRLIIKYDCDINKETLMALNNVDFITGQYGCK
jgi:hypothetical protein